MDLQTVRSTIEQHKHELRDFGLRRVGIFGSLARDSATAKSDIDLLLDFDPDKKTYRNFFGGTVCLETLLRRPVDTVTPQGLSPYIKPYVERDITYVQITD
ncbi:nucleotidyltransferase family protein [Candidatus Gottesmanbacteria bacterium]|nr:nucleotidyltransferase family protein [Candidatus Gottesmanbacteria bacterium]